MHTYIFEHSGILLQVEYELVPEVEFKDIRVLDCNYLPTGPNLVPMLHDTLVLTGIEEATRFLSLVSEEIYNAQTHSEPQGDLGGIDSTRAAALSNAARPVG